MDDFISTLELYSPVLGFFLFVLLLCAVLERRLRRDDKDE
jgi:hypothetical protein